MMVKKKDGVNGIIVYRSKYGAAKKYAEWIEQETGFDCIEVSNAKPLDLRQYDILVLCGGVYASSIAGLSFLKKNMSGLSAKMVAVFCIGASPYDEQAFKELKKRNLSETLKDIPLFYGRGALNKEKMTFLDRAMCKMMKKFLDKKDPSTFEPWMRALTESFDKSCDWTDKAYLTPLLEYIMQYACYETDKAL